MALEKKLQSLILADLESIKHCECFKIMRTNKRFVPDIFFTTPKTKGVFVEVKSLEKYPNPGQAAMIQSLNQNGTYSFSVNTFDQWKTFKKFLKI